VNSAGHNLLNCVSEAFRHFRATYAKAGSRTIVFPHPSLQAPCRVDTSSMAEALTVTLAEPRLAMVSRTRMVVKAAMGHRIRTAQA